MAIQPKLPINPPPMNLAPLVQPLYMAWNGAGLTLDECKLACALTLYVRFEDGTTLDDATISKVIGAASGLKNQDIHGLVDHLRRTNDVYPDVLAHGQEMAVWARHSYNFWLDRWTAPVGQWP